MNARQTRVLDILRSLQPYGAYVDYLADRINAPEPSIRRTIQELRAQGHNVARVDNGHYRLQA